MSRPHDPEAEAKPDATAPLAGCLPAFARHNGYPPRHGWLAKAHAALREDPLAFSRRDAPVTLGVGSSMVPALRFWSRAFGLIDEDERVGRHTLARPTRRGTWLLNEDEGADPYLEDPATLWLLHWWLLSARPCRVPTFRFLFGHWPSSRFTHSELRTAVQNAAITTGWPRPADRRVSRDITALTAMYATTPHQRERPSGGEVEEFVSNPFRQLGLLSAPSRADGARPGTTAGRGSSRGSELLVHRFRGATAPRVVLTYACLRYAHDCGFLGPGSIALARLRTEPRSPGRLLLADDRALRAAVAATAQTPAGRGIDITTSPAGEDAVCFAAAPATVADRLLTAHYRVPNGPDSDR
ncbi:DUF4007 family protein [Streptomyces sp. 4N509B]|uniref:DUF4007 family protein n=1 Tax=Streptomyces sp. 4N509B TaxID=3457413 RepID=UPI003FD5358B